VPRRVLGMRQPTPPRFPDPAQRPRWAGAHPAGCRCRRASGPGRARTSAAAATAATVPAVCDEPPAIAPDGSVLSPYSNDTFSSVTPSRRRHAAPAPWRLPMPISWPAVDTVTRPSAFEPQPALDARHAVVGIGGGWPRPCPEATRRRAGCRGCIALVPAEARGAVGIGLHQVARRVRRMRRRIVLGLQRRRSSIGSIFISCASSSIALSSAKVADRFAGRAHPGVGQHVHVGHLLAPAGRSGRHRDAWAGKVNCSGQLLCAVMATTPDGSGRRAGRRGARPAPPAAPSSCGPPTRR